MLTVRRLQTAVSAPEASPQAAPTVTGAEAAPALAALPPEGKPSAKTAKAARKAQAAAKPADAG